MNIAVNGTVVRGVESFVKGLQAFVYDGPGTETEIRDSAGYLTDRLFQDPYIVAMSAVS